MSLRWAFLRGVVFCFEWWCGGEGGLRGLLRGVGQFDGDDDELLGDAVSGFGRAGGR